MQFYKFFYCQKLHLSNEVAHLTDKMITNCIVSLMTSYGNVGDSVIRK